MKKFLNRIYQALRGPAATALGKNEPAIVGGIVGMAVTIATHYGLSLTAQQQTYVSSGSFLLITWLIRQLVTPNPKVAMTKDQATELQDAGLAPPPVVTHIHNHTHHHVAPAKKPVKKAAPRKRTAAKKTTARRR